MRTRRIPHETHEVCGRTVRDRSVADLSSTLRRGTLTVSQIPHLFPETLLDNVLLRATIDPTAVIGMAAFDRDVDTEVLLWERLAASGRTVLSVSNRPAAFAPADQRIVLSGSLGRRASRGSG